MYDISSRSIWLLHSADQPTSPHHNGLVETPVAQGQPQVSQPHPDLRHVQAEQLKRHQLLGPITRQEDVNGMSKEQTEPHKILYTL